MTNLVRLRGEPVSLRIDSIVEPEFQLRINYEQEALDALGNSLSEEGMLYPLLVWKHGESGYELIAGSRRLRAAKIRGYTEIPAYIVDAKSPEHAIRLALTENLQREDLDPFEEARGFLRLIFEYKMSQKEIARSLSKTEAFIRNRLALLSLPEIVQEMIASGKLGLQFVNRLGRLPTGEEQVKYANLVVNSGLTQI
jgi:ParB family transcriptional regulator, chromosome partitioning protein